MVAGNNYRMERVDSIIGALELLHLAIYHKDPHSELLIRSKEILREIKRKEIT